MDLREHRLRDESVLRGQLDAALVPTRGKNAAAGAGAHAQPESVNLGTTTVVWLERTFTHY